VWRDGYREVAEPCEHVIESCSLVSGPQPLRREAAVALLAGCQRAAAPPLWDCFGLGVVVVNAHRQVDKASHDQPERGPSDHVERHVSTDKKAGHTYDDCEPVDEPA
jgi:hypothetical protein